MQVNLNNALLQEWRFRFTGYPIFNERYQKMLDDLTIYPTQRWIFTGILGFLYIIRAVTADGWYVVTVRFILISMLLEFIYWTCSWHFWPQSLTLPWTRWRKKTDPRFLQTRMMNSDHLLGDCRNSSFGSLLLTRFYATRAFLIAFTCTMFNAFDLPVFWPILLVYFIILFVLTMRRQIQHMIKYKYVPWNNKKVQAKILQ